ncbi:tetratricopeptide repeat protein [Luteimonas sp. BDR2-5]|uniref:serine/threonine-protein kinase n=1 Tax=Proluteimonas luteida TaxID=2878685 RepID=UPI001E4931F6|nr:serine/threonine-protein kinase [Luteimonas sp. BDR2-5]MCD9029478.1 tetratricopeptide repeat protein [Luteimonas sp. BDR2-5]
MDTERWQRLSPALDALLELDPPARAARLQALRDDDPDLADELERLLLLEADSGDFLAEPVVASLSGALPGHHIGPYELERLLGEGGMGQVWLARRADGLYERRVALKLLRPGLADPDLRLRFTRERQILARLVHPYIARLLDAGISADQQPYLALDYIDGEPITDWCRARQPSVPERIALFLQVCAAVSHAHANLIVHRDLKPSNILVTALDDVRLLDFGIAKLLDSSGQTREHTRTGVRAFTLHYAAPEQILGEPVTTMTDVYSLGMVLYELLAGCKPFALQRPSDAQWEQAILDADPVRPSQALQRNADAPAGAHRREVRAISGDLDNIVLRTLSKRPEHRYPSVEALGLDLRRWLEGRPVQARAQGLAYRARKYLRRHRWAVSTATLVVVTLIASMVAVSWQAQQAIRESTRAQAMQDFVIGLFEHAGATHRGAPLDVRELLTAGVQRGDTELARQPLARAELYGVVARLRLGLGDYDQSLALLQRQADILQSLDDPPAGLRVQAVTDIGRTLRLMGRQGDCLAGMLPMRPLVLQREQTLPRQASEFHAQLGRCHRDLGELDAARVLFQRALGLRRELQDDAGIVETLADLASLRSAAGETARARDEIRAALARLRGSLGPRHPLAIELLRTQCALERAQSDMRTAERSCAEAVSLAFELHGARHPATLDARRQLAAIHVDQGRFIEADNAFRDALGWTVARLGTHHADVARIHNSLGIIAWERGDIEVALRDLERATAVWADTGPRVLHAGGLFNQAMVLHDIGRDAEARALLEQALPLRIAQLGDTHGLVGDTLRLLGEVDAALDAPEARDALARAVALTAADYGPRHSHTLRAQLSLARFDARRGDDDALQQLDALGMTPETDAELRRLAWLARAYAADVRCSRGERLPARTALTAVEAQMRQAQPEGGAVVREVEAIRAGCGQGLARR